MASAENTIELSPGINAESAIPGVQTRLQQTLQNLRDLSQQQKLAMTQTMQQAIQILHYSTSDLVDFLQEQSLENPLISVTIG